VSAAPSSASRAKVFVRDDGVALRVAHGFRERVLSAPKVSVRPKPGWGASDYAAAAQRKLRGSGRVLAQLERRGGSLEGASVLEVGCGTGVDCLLLALAGAECVVGIDLELPIDDSSENGERARRLTRAVLDAKGVTDGLEKTRARLPLRLVRMDATRMTFSNASFDFVYSRAALEHVIPIERAFAEIARVVRPGGLLHYTIDPFYWLRGCHKDGLVDIPWAHARLSAAEYRRFVTLYEGEAKARKRSARLESLNQLGLRQWRALIEASPFEILAWQEDVSPLAETLLAEHPGVLETRLDGVTERDLVHSTIRVWLRNRHG
jgi:ubiquinone/menaquinone biosynthesis C-methylase UbiE